MDQVSLMAERVAPPLTVMGSMPGYQATWLVRDPVKAALKLLVWAPSVWRRAHLWELADQHLLRC